MFKKTFLFVSVIILVLIAFAGCDNFKSKLSTQTTDDKAWDIFFNKGASSSDVQKAEEHIRTQLIKDGFNSQLVEEILGSLREGTSPYL